MYQHFIEPIAHRGSTDHVTADELRNCLSRVSAALAGPEVHKTPDTVAQDTEEAPAEKTEADLLTDDDVSA